ncbi:MAG: NADP-dependent phosphogluconate dehydrogenase [Pseudomonadota bacterium]
MSETKTGLIGLGTMGANLALNIVEEGFPLAVMNRTVSTMHDFVDNAGDLAPLLTRAETLEDLVNAIATPRTIILMVPAGSVVDDHIEQLRPLIAEGDLIIDAGNANFHDTNRRADASTDNIETFMGIGVSGGAEGARHGPSIMLGGDGDVWERVKPLMQAIAADFEGAPCATFMGPGGSGHFVKMVHNGIEYADMQMIAEVYGIMRDGFGMSASDISDVFAKWNEGPLASYLIEITAEVLQAAENGTPLIDLIKDSAGQKGTGRWTSIEALMIGAPITAIDAAVAMRNLSARIDERREGEEIFGPAPKDLSRDDLALETLEGALLAGKIGCYAQGFAMLHAASDDYGWNLPMPEIAKVWRAGCIIRSAMLDDMSSALEKTPDKSLMFAPTFAEKMKANHGHLRTVVAQGATCGHPTPALSAALSYFDVMRTGRGTANVIQAQRDFFGAHGFERLDNGKSDQHGPWVDTQDVA